MSAPDVTNESTGDLIISSEDDETDHLEGKTMAELGMIHCARLTCDDFLQNFNVLINIVHTEEKLADGIEFEVKGELPKPSTEEETKETNGKESQAPSCSQDSDDMCIIDDDELVVIEPEEESEEDLQPPRKKKKVEAAPQALENSG